MYNRYVRQQDGTYRRVPTEPPKREAPPARDEEAHWIPFEESHASHREHHHEKQQEIPDLSSLLGEGGMVKKILQKLHLENVDTGDLLLLLLLFLLFSEGEDMELLIALGLLLIL